MKPHIWVVQFNKPLSSKLYQRCTNKTSTARTYWINRGCKLKKTTIQHQRPQNNRFALFSFFFLFASMWTNNSSRDTSALSSSDCVWLAPPCGKIQWLLLHSYVNAVVVYHSSSPTCSAQANCDGKELHDGYTKSHFMNTRAVTLFSVKIPRFPFKFCCRLCESGYFVEWRYWEKERRGGERNAK